MTSHRTEQTTNKGFNYMWPWEGPSGEKTLESGFHVAQWDIGARARIVEDGIRFWCWVTGWMVMPWTEIRRTSCRFPPPPSHFPYSKMKHLFFLIFLMLIYFWETEHKQGRGRERGRHRIQGRIQALSVSTEPDAGLELTNHEIMTWAKVEHLTDWATQEPLG